LGVHAAPSVVPVISRVMRSASILRKARFTVNNADSIKYQNNVPVWIAALTADRSDWITANWRSTIGLNGFERDRVAPVTGGLALDLGFVLFMVLGSYIED
jgi:hypothetical protein